MIQIENTFFALAERFNRDCIIICDRGTMDASACKSICPCHSKLGFLSTEMNAGAGENASTRMV